MDFAPDIHNPAFANITSVASLAIRRVECELASSHAYPSVTKRFPSFNVAICSHVDCHADGNPTPTLSLHCLKTYYLRIKFRTRSTRETGFYKPRGDNCRFTSLVATTPGRQISFLIFVHPPEIPRHWVVREPLRTQLT
jgi:hypothetical protein